MATFKGTVTAISQKQGGTSKTGKAWSKIDVTLVYDNSKPEWPKSIVFSVMNDNIEKMGFVVGGEYEVEVDFMTREYNGKTYMSASCWKATRINAQSPGNSQCTTSDNAQFFASEAQSDDTMHNSQSRSDEPDKSDRSDIADTGDLPF